jgi:hypothetical protein
MTARSIPEDGDVVLREEEVEGRVVYVLHTGPDADQPGADQDVLRMREEAIAKALTLAECQHVRAWLTDEGCDFLLLQSFRAVESSDSDPVVTARWRRDDLA